MSREHVLRPALWTAAFFDLAGAVPFAFPGSSMGQFAGLPTGAPVFAWCCSAVDDDKRPLSKHRAGTGARAPRRDDF
jgi:hypothetical protein